MNETTSMSADERAVGSQVSLGWLLSPKEFERECLGTRQKPAYRSWAIGLHMPDELVKFMESELVPKGTGMALFTSLHGMLYPVVVFQAGALQIRIMLSLADALTRDWFREVLSAGAVNVAMEVPETGQLAVATAEVDRRDPPEIEGYIGRCSDLNGELKTADELGLARKLTHVDSVRSMTPGFGVESVLLYLVTSDCAKALGSSASSALVETLH
jgi:hypothetical protein